MRQLAVKDNCVLQKIVFALAMAVGVESALSLFD